MRLYKSDEIERWNYFCLDINDDNRIFVGKQTRSDNKWNLYFNKTIQVRLEIYHGDWNYNKSPRTYWL